MKYLSNLIVPALLIGVLLRTDLLMAQSRKQNLCIVFIGNSITQGSGLPDPGSQAPPVIAGRELESYPGVGQVKIKNAGQSGSTTVDWLPGQKLFLNASAAASGFRKDSSARLLFSLVLGTNDSAVKGPHGSPVSTGDYQHHLSAIVEQLLNTYPGSMIIIHYPTWYSENTYNSSMYLKEGLDRLQTYFPEIDKLVARCKKSYPGRVAAGNPEVFSYFRSHPELFQQEQGQQGIFCLHPNVEGAAQLGRFWAKAIFNALAKSEKH